MCLPLPLRNGTTVVMSKEDELSLSADDEENFTIPITEQENSTQPITITTLLIVKSSAPTTTNASNETADYNTLQTSTEDAYGVPHKHNGWLRQFGTQTVFIPVQYPQGDRDLVYHLMQNVSSVARRKSSVSQKSVRNVYTLPAVVTALVLLTTVAALTITLRRAQSLDFVRSPAIRYHRTVESLTKSQLAKAKASLPTLAGMKGVFGRGRFKEMTDVFTIMGGPTLLRTPDEFFVAAAPDKAELEPCTRIKLLTPEEVARDEL